METVTRDLWEVSLDTVEAGNEEFPLSVHKVVSSDDMLNEILLRLPVISLVLFKSVSKRWFSLIKDASFIKRRSLIPKIDTPFALFSHHLGYAFSSVSFDSRIPSRVKNTFKTEACSSNLFIEQSCNGLFLCSAMPDSRFCVYNPTLNLFKVLPEPHNYNSLYYNFTRMAFDPTKSPHYKVVHVAPYGYFYQIQIYSSETGIWSIVCSCRDPCLNILSGVYLNDVLHWIYYNDRFFHYKLDLVNKNDVLTNIQLPVTVDYCCSLFESRGCLLLVGESKKTHSHQLNVYEMRNGHSEWSLKYSVDHSMFTLCEVKCIALGEREEESFIVINNRKAVLYKFVLKTFCELPDKVDYCSSWSLFSTSFASI